MYCRNCGKELPEGSQFCQECGVRQANYGLPTGEDRPLFPEEDAPRRAPGPQPDLACPNPGTLGYPANGFTAPGTQSGKKRKFRMPFWVLLLVIIGGSAAATIGIMNAVMKSMKPTMDMVFEDLFSEIGNLDPEDFGLPQDEMDEIFGFLNGNQTSFEGLPLTEFDQLTRAAADQMEEKAESLLTEYTSTTFSESEHLNGIDFQGAFFMTAREEEASDDNRCYLVYALDVTNGDETLDYYTYVEFSNILVGEDGTCYVDTDRYESPEEKVYTEAGNYYYDGFASLKDLLAEVLYQCRAYDVEY